MLVLCAEYSVCFRVRGTSIWFRHAEKHDGLYPMLQLTVLRYNERDNGNPASGVVFRIVFLWSSTNCRRICLFLTCAAVPVHPKFSARCCLVLSIRWWPWHSHCCLVSSLYFFLQRSLSSLFLACCTADEAVAGKKKSKGRAPVRSSIFSLTIS